MNRFFKHIIFYSCILFFGCSSKSSKVELPKILRLIPDSAILILIDPALPDHFVAKSPFGEINSYDWVYWGEEENIDDYFKNQIAPKKDLIRVKFSGNTAQQELLKPVNVEEWHKQGLPVRDYEDLKWGDYPVRVITLYDDTSKRTSKIMWVGLNAEGGWTLLFNLVEGSEEKGQSKLWENLIYNTKSISLEELQNQVEAYNKQQTNSC